MIRSLPLWAQVWIVAVIAWVISFIVLPTVFGIIAGGLTVIGFILLLVWLFGAGRTRT